MYFSSELHISAPVAPATESPPIVCCRTAETVRRAGGAKTIPSNIESVQRKYEDTLLALPNVTGVGIGNKGGQPVLKVFVTAKVPLSSLAAEEVVPSVLDGIGVDVEEIGQAEAQ